MQLQKFFSLALFGVLLAACGDSTTGSGGSGGTTSQGGGGDGACSVPADCGAPAGECEVATCVSGTCATAPAQEGAPAKTQAAGDCKTMVCQAGSPASANDDSDLPDDGKDCTIDGCDAGAKTTTPAAAGTACSQDGGSVCDDTGECVECISNADCTAAGQPLCDAPSHTCTPIDCTNAVKDGNETDVDCGGLCAPCDDGKICDMGPDCASGVCMGAVCQVPNCDDGVKNGAETGTDCGGGTCTTCGPDEGCDSGADCTGGECTGMGGTCIPNCMDQVKDAAETDVDCGGGTCPKCEIGKGCDVADANCVTGAYCDVGVCAEKKLLGDACMAGNQCVSAACVDAVCCQSVCNSTCSVCNQPGSVGFCAYIEAGMDPENECNGNGGTDVCDGAGNCGKVGGSTCTGAAECASGNCVDGVCCENPCNGLCKACSAAKTGGVDGVCGNVMADSDPENECSGTLDCNGAGACEPTLANGTTCALGAECTSGSCTDGVCCNNSCNGVCSACSQVLKGTGADGVCGPIVINTDPENECAGALSCTGAASCQKAFGGTCLNAGDCQSGFCTDGVCCDSTCGGLCKACNVAGSAGTCTNIPNGQDPANECAGSKFCTGLGTCN